MCSLQSPEGKEVVTEVRMRDALTKEEWDVRAKVVINATGMGLVMDTFSTISFCNCHSLWTTALLHVRVFHHHAKEWLYDCITAVYSLVIQ